MLPIFSVQSNTVTFLELKLEQPQFQQLPKIVELDKLCLGGLWTKEGYQREIDSPNSTLLMISTQLASENKVQEISLAIGCLWAILEEAHITILAVHPDYQKQGLGQFLLYSLLQDAFNRKLERATLEVRDANQPARSLYQKFGFKVAGKRKGYYPSGEDALILWRSDLSKPEFAHHLELWRQQASDRLARNNWQISTQIR